MGTNDFLTGILLMCVILSAVATKEEQRPKRNIEVIKNLLTSTAVGFKDYVTSIIVSSALSGKQGILYVTKQPNGSYIYHTTNHKIYLKPLAAPQNVLEVVYPPIVSKTPTVSVVQSYLGTKTPEETLQALLRVNNLVQSGILQQELKVPIVPQPPRIVYEVPDRYENEGIYPPELHAPIENPPKEFVEVEQLPEKPELSFDLPVVASPPRTSYGVPLVESIAVPDITPVKVIDTLPSLPEFPPIQLIEDLPKEPTVSYIIPPVVSPSQTVAEPAAKPLALIEDTPINDAAVPAIEVPEEINGISYKQVNNDGRISTYNGNKVRLHNLPIYNSIPTAYVDDGVKAISTRIQSNPNVFRGYSYKLINNPTPNLAIKNPPSLPKAPTHSYYEFNKNSDLSTQEILSEKPEITLRQNFGQTKPYYYKQVRPDGSILYYNHGNENTESQNSQIDISLLGNTGEAVKTTKIYPNNLPLEIQPNPYVNKYSYKQGLSDGVYTTYDGSKYFKLQSGSSGHRPQETPFISNPIKTSVEVFVNNQPTSHSNLSIPSSLDQQAFWYKYQLIGSTNNHNQADIQQQQKVFNNSYSYLQSTENKSDTNYVHNYPAATIEALPIIETYVPTKSAVSFKFNKQDQKLENPDQVDQNLSNFSYVKTHNDGSVVTYDGQIPKITNSVNNSQVNLSHVFLPQESSNVMFSSNSKDFLQKDTTKLLETQNAKEEVKRMTEETKNLGSYSYIQKYDDHAVKQFGDKTYSESENTPAESISQNNNNNNSQGHFSYKLLNGNEIISKNDAIKNVPSEPIIDTRQNTGYSYTLIHNDDFVSKEKTTESATDSQNLLKYNKADKQINPILEDHAITNNNGQYSYTLINHSKDIDKINLPSYDENTKDGPQEAINNKYNYKLINNKDIKTKTDTPKTIEPVTETINNDTLELNPIVVQPEVVNNYSFKQTNSDGSEIKITGHDDETLSVVVQNNSEINDHRGDIP